MQCSATFCHDFRDAEAIPDFNQLAARNDGLAALSERRKNKQHGCSAIVYDDSGFGSRKPLQKLRRVHVTLATRAGLQVVFYPRLHHCRLRRKIPYLESVQLR